MTDELKPVKCGCGGEAFVIKHELYVTTYGVTCYKCGTATNQGFDTEAEAVQAWNRAMSGNIQYVAVFGDMNVPKSKTVG